VTAIGADARMGNGQRRTSDRRSARGLSGPTIVERPCQTIHCACSASSGIWKLNRLRRRLVTCADNFPATPGHVEIVPRRHVESVLDLTHDEFTERDRSSGATDSRPGPDQTRTASANDGAAAGQLVHLLHVRVHVMPVAFLTRVAAFVVDCPSSDPSEWLMAPGARRFRGQTKDRLAGCSVSIMAKSGGRGLRGQNSQGSIGS